MYFSAMVHFPYQIRLPVQRLSLMKLNWKSPKYCFHCCVDCQTPFLGRLVSWLPFHSAEAIFCKRAAFAGSCCALAAESGGSSAVELRRARARPDGVCRGHVANFCWA